MALSRITVWSAGQVLTAADLNGEFNNVLSNPLTLISPTTGNINFANNQAINFDLERTASDPAAGSTGRLVFNTAKSQPQVDDGTVIRTIPALISTNITQGDLIVSASSGSGVWTIKSIGNAGQALVVTSSGGSIGWGTPSVAGGGDYKVHGLVGSVTSSQAGSFACDYIKLRSSAGNATFQMNATSSFTVNAGIVGVGGRDQAGVFASTFVNVYVVSTGANSTTPIGLLSTSPPPIGPTLPSSCSAWAYVATFQYSSASTGFAASQYVTGSRITYAARQSNLSNGAATTEASVSLTATVPSNALETILNYTFKNGGATNNTATIRVESSQDFIQLVSAETGGTLPGRPQAQMTIPNISRNAFYIIANGGTLDLWTQGYTIANG
jgi:hypothetical protein